MTSSGGSVAHLTSLSAVKQNVPMASQHTYRILTISDDVFKVSPTIASMVVAVNITCMQFNTIENFTR